MTDQRRLDTEDMITQATGLGDVARMFGRSLGVQALSGIKGISSIGSGDAPGEVDRYQEKYSPHELSAEGQAFLRRIAPAYYGIANSSLAGAVRGASKAYGQGSESLAGLAGKYLGPSAAGAVGAAADVAPYMINPELSSIGRSASEAGLKVVSDSVPRVMADGSTMGTLDREGEAARRDANGSGYTKSLIPSSQVDPALHGGAMSAPDGAMSVVASDPSTGKQISHVSFVPRGSGLQSIRMDTDPLYQGQGIATDLMHDAVSHAHSQGIPFYSDTQVSAPAARVYEKLKGLDVQRNPEVDAVRAGEGDDTVVGRSSNGRPVYEIHPASSADDAQLSENADPNASGWVASQAYAGGGEVSPILGPLARAMAEYAPLKGMPSKATIAGLGTVDVGPNQAARNAAAAYMKSAGMPYNPPSAYVKADPVMGKRIADAYDSMQHAPDDPAVKASYDAMIRETLAQYQHMKDTGLSVEFNPPGTDPYADSPRLAAEDVKNNNHLYVFPTSSGYGTGDDAASVSGHHLLGDSGETFGGLPATNNDVFRAVHDYFGHIKEGVGFRANGEENAWQQHAGMYSDLARPAMTAETRGQNSWVNFGPHGPANQVSSSANTVYAPQKSGILPDEFNNLDNPEMHFLHMSNMSDPEVTLDPKFYGTGIKGAEARRGGIKTTSLYPANIDPSQIEHGLESKTPYRVSVPTSSMYDMTSDPMGFRSSEPSYSDAEAAIRDAGYAGYHVPDGEGIFRGQGRLFQPTPATRLGPGPVAAPEEDLSSGFASGGPVRFKVGGDAGTVLSPLAEMMAKYAPEAEPLADAIKDKGGVTYNPTSGDVHQSGYVVPTQPGRTSVLDHAPDPNDIHSYLMDHQDAFDEDQSSALHVVSDPSGYHMMSVVHHTPDFGDAADKAGAAGVSGFNDITTGENHPASPLQTSVIPETTDQDAHTSDQQMIEKYLSGPDRQSASWTPGKQTVGSPQRKPPFPGIYKDPRQLVAEATDQVSPEDPLMKRLFGVSRADLSDLSLSRQGNELGILPGATQNPRGSAAAAGIMNPKNEQRLVDVLSEARKSPSLYQGMTGWYTMDPLYDVFRQIYGDDAAPEKYRKLNTLMGMASPGSSVDQEIARGTAANWLDNEGRFNDFIKYGGGVEGGGYGNRPLDMMDVPGHVYHRTSQALPMQQYLDSGSLQMKSPKVPMYIGASGVPETGFQTDVPVGDAHWARAVGLADTRGNATLKGAPVVPGSSVTTPEMQQLAPWWRDRIAGQSGLESVPAQALTWGSFSPQTGVKTTIGAPKLEILSTQIGKAASRLGVSPETALRLVVSGKAGAFKEGGIVCGDD